MGSGIAGGLASGLAVGAGVVAGEELAHHFLDGGQHAAGGGVIPPAEAAEPGNSNSDMGGAHSTVYLHMSGSPPYDQFFQPDGSDAFSITVATMTDRDLDATVSGALSGGGRHVSVTGKLVIHRDANYTPVDAVTGQGVTGPFPCLR